MRAQLSLKDAVNAKKPFFLCSILKKFTPLRVRNSTVYSKKVILLTIKTSLKVSTFCGEFVTVSS
jgi:hypothetical protein